MKSEILQAVIGADQISIDRSNRGRTGRNGVDVAQRDAAKRSPSTLKSSFRFCPAASLTATACTTDRKIGP